MTLTGSALKRRFFFRRFIPLLLASLAIACAPSTALAHKGGWHVEFGLAIRRLFGLGNLSKLTQDAGGFEGDIHIVKSTGGMGVRFEGGTSGPGGRTADIMAGSMLGDPTSQRVEFYNAVNWGAVGPTWCFPLRRGRAEVYVLGGAANTLRWVHEKDAPTLWSTTWPYGLPGGGRSSPTPILIAGGSWSGGRMTVWGMGFGFEAGAELQAAGSLAVWGEPPVLLEGGSYLERTQQVTMSSISFRLGTNLLGWSRKR